VNDELEAIGAKEAAQIGATSLTKYGHLFFPRTFRQKSPEMHEAIGRALYSQDRLNAIEIFRDGAKTTLLRVYASQRIAYAISRTLMYVSVSQDHSKFSLRWLRRQVEHNKRWAQTFGLTPGNKWTDEWLEIRCNLVQDEYIPEMPVTITALAMGITGQIRGFNPDDFRPDLIIADDILNEENTATPEQRKKIEDLLFGALLNSLAPATEVPTAKMVYLQTPFNKEDSAEKCQRDPQWHPQRFGIIEYKDGQPFKSRWEERYPLEAVLKDKEAHVRRSQYRLWMREKECTIVAGEEKALDINKLKYYDVLPEAMDVLVSLDPASSDSPTADEFAIGAIGFKGLNVYLLDYTSAKGVMPDKAANDTFNLILLYGPRKIVVESTSYQRIMAWYLEQEMIKRRMFVAIERLEVKRLSNADRIMQTLPGLMAFGHFHVRPHHTQFIQQADDYDPQIKDIKDDILTMVANAIVSSNPALRIMASGDEDMKQLLEDERDYKPIALRGSP